MIEVVYKGEGQDGQNAILLPKNVRQVGEVHKEKKIYIEDYVVTYMKQKITENKNLGCILILMGRKDYAQDTLYMFVDGAFSVDYGQIGTDYVFTDKVWENIYEQVKKYFISSEIVGWVIYDDDLSEDRLLKAQKKNFPAEDILLLKQESYEDDSVYYLFRNGMLQQLSGFFVYYEKNEAMQEFMVNNYRTNSVEEERQIRQREEPVGHYRSRMRDRREKSVKPTASAGQARTGSGQNKVTGVLYAVSSVLVLLVILVGITVVNNYDKMLDMRESLSEVASGSGQESEETIQETAVLPETVSGETTGEEVAAQESQTQVEVVPAGIEAETESPTPEAEEEPDSEADPEEAEVEEAETEEAETEETEAEEADVVTKVYYTVELGDTLEGISKEVYGSTSMVATICAVNGIDDGDKIQAGQKILLP